MRWHFRFGLALPLLIATAAGSGPAAADGGIPRFLLVWQDATLFTRAESDAPAVRIFTWSADQRVDHPGEVRWVELVAVFEGDLETTSGAERELLCDCVLLDGEHEHLASIQERTLKLCFRPENLKSEERNVAFGSFEDLFGDGE